MGVEAKARATEKDYRVNTTTCMPGAYDQKNIHRRLKGHARPHPSFSWHMGLITTNQASIRSTLDDVAGVQRTAWYRVCVRKYHVVGELFICEKASLSKWSEIRVLRIKKISIASLKLLCHSYPIFSWCTRRIEKDEASARWKFVVFVRA